MQFLDAAATRSGLPFGPLIDALRALFTAGCEVPARQVLTVPLADGTSGTALIMPAWTAGGYFGVKTVMVYPGNSAKGLPGLHSTYVLYDANTGVPLAQMDGNEVTSRRTAAASALAASIVGPQECRNHLVVGAGRVGRLIPEAYRAIFTSGATRIWDRTTSNAQAVVDELRAKGIEAQVSFDLERDAREADIISCATLATAPLIQGEWLRAGAHLDLIGSFTPAMREADDACFAGAALYVDTPEALQKSGDLLGPMSRGVFSAQDVRATLADLCRAATRPQRPGGTRTVFKSVGTALEDLAAATLVMAAQPR